ncbi:hypothetical protein CDAR_222581 [Caerostris darwini]|uniref:Uncharacterized protein n=1 Tax=Caerostris darwini TaxID=1538125 RepID=A0AAV4TGB2_9ARAC|nr:hypothetical protein CDAR_222581 [Caerostris darwini]
MEWNRGPSSDEGTQRNRDSSTPTPQTTHLSNPHKSGSEYRSRPIHFIFAKELSFLISRIRTKERGKKETKRNGNKFKNRNINAAVLCAAVTHIGAESSPGLKTTPLAPSLRNVLMVFWSKKQRQSDELMSPVETN